VLASELERAAAASVVVLEGVPELFCLGLDFTDATTGDVRAKLTRFAHFLGALARCPRPTLAVVDGVALGGGLGLAAVCDYVLASERARFGLPEALYGLAPAIIRPALRTRLSAQQLRMLLFTGYSRTASEGARLGLCDEVVAVDDLARMRRRAIRQLARARSTTVATVRRWDDAELTRVLEAGVAETAAALADPEVRAVLACDEVPWRR
jgi:enoyl-CoA hydratase/carnithine racemase